MAKQIIEAELSVIVYDDSSISHIGASMFDAAHWRGRATSAGQQGGRGSVMFVEHEGNDWVIRHYYRGGLIGKFLTDQFLWMGQEQTRPFAEWHLLQRLRTAGLPAPVPVAARYQRHGFFYTADLITEKLPDVESLAARYLANSLVSSDWRAVGNCIAAFHNQGFCHADLNAWNVQLTATGNVSVLDWDRGQYMQPGKWQQSNLNRLQRSLTKISVQNAQLLETANWAALLDGYRVTN